MESTRSKSESSNLAREIEALKPWFHNIHLGDGVQTSPDNLYGDFPNFKWQQFKDLIPSDLTGWSALDIGCNAGFYSVELAKRGATVLGIDLDPHYLEQAKWVSKKLNLEKRVSFEQMQVYDLARIDGKFDLIIFMGVFYHLRYPMLALDIVAEKVRRLMVFQTMTSPGEDIFTPDPDLGMDDRSQMKNAGWPVLSFIEDKLAGDPTNWWAPNHACVIAMLNTCGLSVVSSPGHEIYVTAPDEKLTAVSQTWNRSEFLSAIGKQWKDELAWKVGR
jgi:tRNA (mo5U34)-methyltransferase